MVNFARLENAHVADPTIATQLQFQSLVYGLEEAGEESKTLRIGPDSIKLEDGLAEDVQVRLVVKPGAWDEYISDVPPVGAQSIASMLETDRLTVIADDIMDFSRHMMMLEKIFVQLRAPKPVAATPYGRVEIEDTVGRYIRLDIDGRPHRVYFEEAGQGVPLICLHTAGSDGRQYRALMNDPDITANYRVIAFDLPWHGKSSPPAGFQKEPYVLTTDGYVGIVMAIKKALQLENPVVMGCSIGGRAVLHLARRHGKEFKAAIGLQSATYAESRAQEKLGPGADGLLHRPDVHGGEASAAAVMQLMSPTSPAPDEWETLWYYMQSGPGVFQGDLYYYFVDGDMRNGLIDGLDTTECPLYLLSGEYDLSATPEMGRELAEAVNATHFQIMEGLGHFPMSEDPARFKTYLMPILEMIRAQ